MRFWAKFKVMAALAAFGLALAVPAVKGVAEEGGQGGKQGKISAAKPKYEERSGADWQEKGRLAGRVRQAPAFKVEVLNGDGKVVLSAEVKAGASSYELQWLKPGVYTLRVSAEGYEALEVKGLEIKVRNDLLVGLEFEK